MLTYRDDETPFYSSLRNLYGQLPPDTFTRLLLTSFSKEAVATMAGKKGYNAEDVYLISGGNPFYVTEILSSYSPGVPENIKGSILAGYDRREERTKHAWQICSVIPEGPEINRFVKIKSSWDEEMDHCFAPKVIMQLAAEEKQLKIINIYALSILAGIEMRRGILQIFFYV